LSPPAYFPCFSFPDDGCHFGTLIEEVKKVKLNPPKIPFVSNVTGTWITTAQATDPNYWAQHLRQTVRFSSGITQLLQEPNRILLEVGSGCTLCSFAKKHLNGEDGQVAISSSATAPIASLRHPKDKQPDVAFLLNTLGKLWLSGVEVKWSGFYVHERRHRLPLPTYPFKRQRYWIEPQKRANAIASGAGATAPIASTQESLSKKPDIADWFYLPVWKQSVSPALLGHTKMETQTSCTLVFVDECGLGEALVKRLELEGQDVITVSVGSGLTKQSEREYTLNPRQGNDYEALLNELLAQNKLPKTIVHLWSVTPYSSTTSELKSLEESQAKGFYSLLFLAQALGKQNTTDEFQITVISNNLQSLTGLESLCPEKATVLGAIKVIPQEYPNINCRSIDVGLTSPPTPLLRGEGSIASAPPFPCREGGLGGLGLPNPNSILRTYANPSLKHHLQGRTAVRPYQIWGLCVSPILLKGTWEEHNLTNYLLAELTAQSSDSVIAYRGLHRWVQTFEPVRLNATREGTPKLLKEGGVYLITGGLGGIGLALAEYLAQTVQAKLILVSRSALPNRDEWEKWLVTHTEQDSVSRKIRKVQELEKLGLRF
jgi:acyl transferase domain-containing protein